MDTKNHQANAILLLNQRKTFNVIKNAFAETGYQHTGDIEAFKGAGLAVMDSFYLKAGAAEFIKKENRQVSVLLVLFENEGGELQGRLSDLVDDIVVIDYSNPDEIYGVIAEWLREKKDSFETRLETPEFGQGLWASVLTRLGAAS